jgi:hypothetical protein
LRDVDEEVCRRDKNENVIFALSMSGICKAE